jgi:hypothetical protein
VELVILTGGNSQWYWIDEVLKGANDCFSWVGLPQVVGHPELLLRMELPTETVARGLVYSKLPMKIVPPKPKPEPDDPKPAPVDPCQFDTLSDAVLDKNLMTRIAVGRFRLGVTRSGRVLSLQPGVLTQLDNLIGFTSTKIFKYSHLTSIAQICFSIGDAVLFRSMDGRLVSNHERDLSILVQGIDMDRWSKCVSYSYNGKVLVGVTADGSLISTDYQNFANQDDIAYYDRIFRWSGIKQFSFLGESIAIGLKKNGHFAIANRVMSGSDQAVRNWLSLFRPEFLRNSGPDIENLGNDIIQIASCTLQNSILFAMLNKYGRVSCYGDIDAATKAHVEKWEGVIAVGIQIGGCVGILENGSMIRADASGTRTLHRNCAAFACEGTETLCVTKDGKLHFEGFLVGKKTKAEIESWDLDL